LNIFRAFEQDARDFAGIFKNPAYHAHAGAIGLKKAGGQFLN